MSTSPNPSGPSLETILLAVVVVYVAALRLFYDINAPAMGDEAYYWMWGQRLGWSYFDHPPLDAWLQAGIAAVFGWSTVSLRLLTWLTLGGNLAILWLWAQQLAPERNRELFLRTAAILLTVPVIALFTFAAFHDHLLVFFAVLAMYALWRFAEAWGHGRGGIRFLYLAGAAIGLATLSKYNGALLGVGALSLFVFQRSLWGSLRTPHPYLAGLLAIIIQTPVIYWNLTEGFATLSYHFVERPSNHWNHPAVMQGVGFVAQSFIAAGPILMLAALRFPWVMRDDRSRRQRAVSVAVFLGASLVVLAASLFTDILLHWNIVAYVALAMAGSWLLGRWLIWPQIAMGLYLMTVAIWNYSVAPAPVPGFLDPAAPANYGWAEVAKAAQTAKTQHPGAFLAATKYNYAAQLGFALHTLDVTAINPLRSQYDLWWQPVSHIGQDGIIVADAINPISLSSAWFTSMAKLTDVPVIVGGKQVWTFEIYLGQGYHPR